MSSASKSLTTSEVRKRTEMTPEKIAALKEKMKACNYRNFDSLKHSITFGYDNDVEARDCAFTQFKGQTTYLKTDAIQIVNLDEENFIGFFPNALAEAQVADFLAGVQQTPHFRPDLKPGAFIPPRQELSMGPAEYNYSGQKRPCIIGYPEHVEKLIGQVAPLVDQLVGRARENNPALPPVNPYTEPSSSIEIVYGDPKIPLGGSIAPHADDEDPNWGLISVYSLGQSRQFIVTPNPKTNPDAHAAAKKWVAKTADNSLIVMFGPSFQQRYLHEVPKLKESESYGPDKTPLWKARVTVNVRMTKPSSK